MYKRVLILFTLITMTLTSMSFLIEDLVQVRAFLIYNVSKHITYGTEKQKGDFVIGVYGDNPVADYLKSLSKYKTVNNRRLVVKKVYSVFEVVDCHVMVTPNDKIKEFNGVCYVGNVLLFSYGKDALDKGAHIASYVGSDNKPKIIVSIDNMLNCNLKPSKELIQMAQNK